MRGLMQRWAYFVLGGALFTPYALFAILAVPLAGPTPWTEHHGGLLLVVLTILTPALLAITSLIPLVRTVEGAAVPVLLGGHAASLRVTPARTWGARLRGAVWFLGHTIGGAAISLATVLGVPTAVLLLTGAWQSGSRIHLRLAGASVERAWAVPIALAILIGLVVVVALSGQAAAWLAPVLLGPDPIARMEELERRATELTERNRLAQELHDSMGHALTVTTLTRRLRQAAGPQPKVLVVTTFENDEYVYDALRAGASGFLLKRAPAEEMVHAIRTVVVGESLLFPSAIRQLAAVYGGRAGVRLARAGLTEREQDVLRLMAAGGSNAEIAADLFVSVETVKTHVGSVLGKLGARDRTQAVIAAYESGFVSPNNSG